MGSVRASKTDRLRQALRDTAAILGLAAGLILLTAAALPPERLEASLLGRLPPCPQRLAGSRCALCGMTHSFAAMARGRWSEARAHNPLGPAAFAGVALLAALGLTTLAPRRRRARAAWLNRR